MFELVYYREKNGRDVQFTMQALTLRSILRQAHRLSMEAQRAQEYLALEDLRHAGKSLTTIVSEWDKNQEPVQPLHIADVPDMVLAKCYGIVEVCLHLGWYADDWFEIDITGARWALNVYDTGSERCAVLHPVRADGTTDTSKSLEIFRKQGV